MINDVAIARRNRGRRTVRVLGDVGRNVLRNGARNNRESFGNVDRGLVLWNFTNESQNFVGSFASSRIREENEHTFARKRGLTNCITRPCSEQSDIARVLEVSVDELVNDRAVTRSALEIVEERFDLVIGRVQRVGDEVESRNEGRVDVTNSVH